MYDKNAEPIGTALSHRLLMKRDWSALMAHVAIDDSRDP